MRSVVIAVLFALMLPATASAQMSPSENYPVCMQIYGPLNYSECRYTSIPQCQVSASGRAAQCLENPYFVASSTPRRKRQR